MTTNPPSLSNDDLKKLYFNKEYSQIITLLSHSLTNNYESIFHLNLLGMCYLNLNEANSSIDYFLKCIKYKKAENDFSNLEVLYINLASAYLFNNDDNCLEYYLEAFKINNKNIKLLLLIIDYYFNRSDMSSARQYISKVLELDSNNETALFKLFQILSFEKKLNEASKIIKTLIKLSNNPYVYKYYLGNIFLEKEDYKNSEKLYLEIISKLPEFSECHNNLGVIYDKTNNLEKSRKCFLDSLALEPENIKFLNNLSSIYIREGNFEEAQSNLEWTLSLEKENFLTLRLLAKYHHSNSDLKLSQDYIEKSLSIEPNNVTSLIQYGLILFSRNFLKQANDEYLKALDLSPNNLKVLLSLGHFYTITNSTELAIKYLNEAIKVDPGNSFSKNLLAGIYKTNSDYNKAKEFYLDSKELNWEENVLECLYLDEKIDDFEKFYLTHSDNLTDSRTVSALITHANLCLDKNYNHSFCNDPLSYIKVIKCNDVINDINTFNNDLVNEITNYSYEIKKQTFIKNGIQSLGNLFALEIDIFKKLEKMILENYYDYFSSFNQSKDIFINKYPKNPKLMGWFVKISKNGFIEPHNHVGSWLSGVYYLDCLESNSDEGSIEFSLSKNSFPFKEKNLPYKIIRPEKSLLVLFPSQLFHRSIPFNKNFERICIAFDFLPQPNTGIYNNEG